MDITTAFKIAKTAHAGLKYGVGDYFEDHILKVVDLVAGDPFATTAGIITAYLHDVVEDTDVTLEDLEAAGFEPAVLAAVDVITRKAGVVYADYILMVAEDEIATTVKIADLKSHLGAKPPGSLEKRYLKALAVLEATLVGLE